MYYLHRFVNHRFTAIYLLCLNGIGMIQRTNSVYFYFPTLNRLKRAESAAKRRVTSRITPGFAPLLALATALCVSACSGQRAIVPGTSSTSVSPDLAFASLGPGSPPVLSIVQTDYANATRQAIALGTSGSTPGQNELRVDIFGIDNGTVARDTTLSDRPLGQAGLAAEAQAALPTVPLRPTLNYVQNRYGPFGYAIGRSAQGDTCLYAWQRIATPEIQVSIFNRRATITMRLRLCEPDATEAMLVASMMNLQVNASLSGGSWTPEPKPLSPDFAAPGVSLGPAPIVSAADHSEPATPAATVTPPAPAAAPVRRVRRAAPRPAEPALAAPPPVINGPLVPPPPAMNARPTGGVAVPPPQPYPGTQP